MRGIFYLLISHDPITGTRQGTTHGALSPLARTNYEQMQDCLCGEQFRSLTFWLGREGDI